MKHFTLLMTYYFCSSCVLIFSTINFIVVLLFLSLLLSHKIFMFKLSKKVHIRMVFYIFKYSFNLYISHSNEGWLNIHNYIFTISMNDRSNSWLHIHNHIFIISTNDYSSNDVKRLIHRIFINPFSSSETKGRKDLKAKSIPGFQWFRFNTDDIVKGYNNLL